MPNKQKIQRLIALVMAIVAMVSFVQSASAEDAQVLDVTCSVLKTANVRSGPGTNYTIVGNLKAEDSVVVSEKNTDGSWLKHSGGGWTAAFLLNCTGESSSGQGSKKQAVNVPPEGITFTGVRDSIPLDQVDYAKGGFTSEWPMLGHVLAEPGKLAVGWDFPQEKIDASGGAIWRVDPGNQYRLNDMSGSQLDGCAEGALMYISAQHLKIQVREFTISIKVPDGDGAHIYLKCPFSDGVQGKDLGADVVFSQFKPNFALVQHYSGQPNGGFVSLNGAKQALGISQSGRSSGSEGASNTWLIGFDINTGAYSIMRWDGTTMHQVASNWYHGN